MNIPFNIPPYIGTEEKMIAKVIENRKICGDGEYTKKCNVKLEEMTSSNKVLTTTSCTSALEMSAILADIQPGDEVIMPSYTFVSTANAFVLRGATIVFVDIRPDTLNIDEALIEDAITPKTKAIVPVHYAGVGCEMSTICEIARRHGASWGITKTNRSALSVNSVASLSMKPRTILRVKAVLFWSMNQSFWKGQRLLEKRVRTEQSSLEGMWTSTHGWMSAPLICRVNSIVPISMRKLKIRRLLIMIAYVLGTGTMNC